MYRLFRGWFSMAMLNYQTVLILTVVSIFGCPSADVASTSPFWTHFCLLDPCPWQYTRNTVFANSANISIFGPRCEIFEFRSVWLSPRTNLRQVRLPWIFSRVCFRRDAQITTNLQFRNANHRKFTKSWYFEKVIGKSSPLGETFR